MTQDGQNREPPDHHVYLWVTVGWDAFHFFLNAIKFYESLLEGDLKAVEVDEDLRKILDEKTIQSFDIYRYSDRARRSREFMEKIITEQGKDNPFYDILHISHWVVRFLKSVGTLYLRHLKVCRNKLASKANVSRHALQAVDNRITLFESKTGQGVFGSATPIPLLAGDLDDAQEMEQETTLVDEDLARARRPRPVVLDSIQILDEELRKRCLDLFELFREDGKRERLDTVIAEATRILEARLRSLSKAPRDCVGIELAKRAFAGEKPMLRVSDVPAEQEAAHLLYRGIFGLIRNPAQHHLMGELIPERVLQILGFVDYLLELAESAQPDHDDKKE